MQKKMTRRQFLILAGAVGAVAVPARLGYAFFDESRGENPPTLSPYAPSGVLETWPAEPDAASLILVLIDEGGPNPFGLYLGEILRAEGLNAHQVGRLADLADAPLGWYDIVILAEGRLSDGQAERLENYVAGGGRLVAMRPDRRLAHVFGVAAPAGETAEGYLQVAAGAPASAGIEPGPLQYHGAAGHYRLAGAAAVAWLLDGQAGTTGFPAVTLHKYGEGEAVLWAFDLARSIAYMRQGNPEWANQERDGGSGIRTVDMFVDWIDLERMTIPQADEEQRLLANLLAVLSHDRRPLPRLWYFPAGTETVFVATGDAHKIPAYAIAESLKRVEARAGGMTIYYTPPLNSEWRRAASRGRELAASWPAAGDLLMAGSSRCSPRDIAAWRERGHEFGLHPYVEDGLQASWRRYWQEFTGLGYGPVPPTTRTHRILWSGWAETARVQASAGIRMNLDYYHWGPALRHRGGEWAHGHFNGSGRPMRFVDAGGRVLNIFQQATQLADDHLLKLRWGGQPWGGEPNLGAEGALEVSRALLLRSLSDHTAIAANFHPDLFFVAPDAADEWSRDEAARWLEGTLDIAAEHQIPISPADKWLGFVEARDAAAIEALEWLPDAGVLSFVLRAPAARDCSFELLIPLRHGELRVSQVEVDAGSASYRERTVAGIAYASATLLAGQHRVVVTYA